MDRLFPKAMFQILLAKVIKDLNLATSSQARNSRDKISDPSPSSYFLRAQGNFLSLLRVMLQEWMPPFHGRQAPHDISRFYVLPDSILNLLRPQQWRHQLLLSLPSLCYHLRAQEVQKFHVREVKQQAIGI